MEGVQIAVNVNKNAVSVPQTTTDETPPGWNRGRRFMARWVLWFVVFTLLSGRTIWATIFSAMSIIIMKEGTLFSGKNIKWMLLSGISFLASLGSWSMSRGSEVVDEDKAYGLKMSLWLMAKSTQVVWGMILAVFLFSAATSRSSPPKEVTKAMTGGHGKAVGDGTKEE
ncbi:unnamed protein product [Pseudo-nitzschia multistriata]|uniref:Uncharacterized protein n=1 Tax=Pseudo-nitzschia multistriata TaxID=183589 RepID=A0A448ZIE9_9STRA|nr:unnamed protein product [Pseudo-nitzschia multistriata]